MKRQILAILLSIISLNVRADRIAVSNDGNLHDRDDIDSTAVVLAEISADGRSADLVFIGRDDHFWSTNTSWETDMYNSQVGTISRWGPFPNCYQPTTGVNVRSLHPSAVTALKNAINASTATNRLHILMCGPAQFVGEALAASNQSARQYVTIYSHSDWNNNHAVDSGAAEGLATPRYAFSQFTGMGAQTVQIIDQNAGLNRPFSEYYWMRDSTDMRIQWLWTQGQVAAKTTYDCSDAGLAYYLLTLDQNATPAKLQAFLVPTATPTLNGLTLLTSPDGCVVGPLVDGNVINANQNITVRADPSGNIGSVVFQVDGAVFRTESSLPYTLNGDSNGVFTRWNPGVGSHTINATPYSASNGTGTPGAPVTVTCTVQ